MSSLRGFNVLGCQVIGKNDQPLDEAYLKRYGCGICHYILRQALQIECGDRICKGCLPTEAFNCPVCEDEIDPTKLNQFFNDRSCQKDVRGFSVLCKCGEKMLLTEWEQHVEECEDMQKVKPKPSAATSTSSTGGVERLEKEMKQTKAEVADQKKQVTRCVRKIESFEKDIRQMKQLLEEVRRGVAGGIPPRTSTDGDSGQDLGVVDRLNTTVTKLVSDIEQQKGAMRQLNLTVDHLNQNYPRMETVLEELNLKIEILEVKSTNGIYIWKINDLDRRAREARVGRTVSLYSPPFYTSPHGYRLCLRAYLHGDGSGKGTHISLFIVVMKSEYDALLYWPFQHKVSLTLLNQDYPLSADRSITHRFIPNADSGSFSKPVDTFNVASGFPEFAPLSVLNDQSYCKNSTLYFRIRLDPPEYLSCPDELRD